MGSFGQVAGPVDGKNVPSVFSVVLDGGAPLQINFSDVSDGIIYETPSLSEGFHLLEVNLSSPTFDQYFDYALINPGPSTPLINASDTSYQALFVNYTDPTIVYKGQWNDSSGLPFKTTFNRGATMQFPLPGYNVTLLGHITPGFFPDEFQLDNIFLNVTIDDHLPVTYNVSTPMGTGVKSASTLYIECFTAQEEVDFQIHNITVEVIELSGLPFIFRGFTYISFFDTLKDMPNLTELVFTPPITSHTIPTGRLTGAIVGSLIGVGLAVLVMLMIWRKKQRVKEVQRYRGIPEPNLMMALNSAKGKSFNPFLKTYVAPVLHHASKAQVQKAAAVLLPPSPPSLHENRVEVVHEPLAPQRAR
ncbi:hypothetical protein BDP27DRAFT_1009002 [Rhodocollybia butyracea]|uniref:Uncharacterized protein n=1 Tax=Rhodocollybia butyracea TaxID=206335 RepID=A0A9P5TWP6_9AGAR|nr:hypothetical protein BDP27DRAFT_1009002 [Rhodocollybia butyracea]